MLIVDIMVQDHGHGYIHVDVGVGVFQSLLSKMDTEVLVISWLIN